MDIISNDKGLEKEFETVILHGTKIITYNQNHALNMDVSYEKNFNSYQMHPITPMNASLSHIMGIKKNLTLKLFFSIRQPKSKMLLHKSIHSSLKLQSNSKMTKGILNFFSSKPCKHTFHSIFCVLLCQCKTKFSETDFVYLNIFSAIVNLDKSIYTN
jgi:hypothetical protein